MAHNQVRRCLALGALTLVPGRAVVRPGPDACPGNAAASWRRQVAPRSFARGLAAQADGVAGGQQETLGGRPGPSVPRVPSAITEPGQRPVGVPEQEGITAPTSLPLAEVPLFGPLAFPGGSEDEGPPDGLTLDQAIERLVRENLGLRARSLELPQAEADILTAEPARQPAPLRRQPAHSLRDLFAENARAARSSTT